MLLCVGPKEERTEFPVHKHLLCAKSPYFAAACDRYFRPDLDNCIFMYEEHPEIMEFFIDWVYGHPMFVLKPESTTSEVLLKCRLYAVANRLRVEILKNEIVDEIFQFLKANQANGAAMFCLVRLHGRIPIKCNLRSMLMDAAMDDWTNFDIDEYYKDGAFNNKLSWLAKLLGRVDFSSDFELRCVQWLSGFKNSLFYRHTPCYYHDHEETPRCKI